MRARRGTLVALMNEELYTALLEAGAGDDKARAAARSVADYDNRLTKLAGDLGLVKWMVGFNLALTVAVLLRLFLVR